jgi:uncharacterized protein (TIGR00369 family)
MAAMDAFESQLAKLFGTLSPHMRRLGFEIVSLQGGICVARLPYDPQWVGDITSGVLHGGVVTSLLDTAGGASVLSANGAPISLATLDLRIDYLRAARPEQSLFARVECYKKTQHIAFARGIAYEALESEPVASMAATYMLRTQTVRAASSA